MMDGYTEDYMISAMSSPIRSLCLTRHERHVLVGLEDGEMRVFAHDPEYLREKLHVKLVEIGVLDT